MPRIAPVLSILAVAALATAPTALAQDSEPEPTLEFELPDTATDDDSPASIPLPERRLDITDAHIEGSGPWTSLFGARPERTLVMTVVNTGFVAVDNPSVVLTLGKGPDPTGFVTPPELGRLEPGDSITVRTDLELPVMAVGTYAVEGSIPGFDTPVQFRAESSHVPWLLMLIPLLILLQVGLVSIRNRVRTKIHEPKRPASTPITEEFAPATTGPTEPVPTTVDLTADEDKELENIIGEELGAVFDDAFRQRDGSIDDADFHEVVVELAATASGRVAARTMLSETERQSLDTEIADAVLGAFGFEPDTAR